MKKWQTTEFERARKTTRERNEGIIVAQPDPDTYQSILTMLDYIKRNGPSDLKSKHVFLCERESLMTIT